MQLFEIVCHHYAIQHTRLLWAVLTRPGGYINNVRDTCLQPMKLQLCNLNICHYVHDIMYVFETD